MKMYVIRIFTSFLQNILENYSKKGEKQQGFKPGCFGSITRVKIVVNWIQIKIACIFVIAALRLYTNALSTLQTSCKISLAAPINVCSCLGQEDRENASNRRNLHLLEIQSPHDALRRAQMCDQRISVVYLRHHGIVIYMKTPYVAQGTSARDNSWRVVNGIHFGPVRR